ncbi:MAG TPA: mechanosensitive ion channel domain-containing protein [Chitinophagaceae bacterium]|nr:mechanosensitive ion channel domain-containing protein [Chitinophagaceae bacterium]
MKEIIQEVASVYGFIDTLIEKIGLDGSLGNLLSFLISLFILFFACWLFYRVFNKVVSVLIRAWMKKLKFKNGTIFLEKKVVKAVGALFSGILFYNLLPVFYVLSKSSLRWVRIPVIIYIIIMLLFFISRTMRSIEFLGHHSKRFEKKPISSYTQVAQIVAYILCGILVISILFGKSPMAIITAFGAGMAIIVLVFQDLILGLVASIQISVNDMVRVGDWIVVQDYNADGEVEEINLTTVKIRNWDYTLANVPTYALVKNGFYNVRERDDLGVRRFKQHLLIDLRTIKKIDEHLIEKLKEKGLFDGDIQDLKWTEGEKYEFSRVTTITNLSLFRKYMEAYLFKHPGIDNGYMVVRHLQPDGKGQPLEIYAFVKSVSFKPLNYIMADVFEHLYSVIREFELEMYQIPAGDDFKRKAEN